MFNLFTRIASWAAGGRTAGFFIAIVTIELGEQTAHGPLMRRLPAGGREILVWGSATEAEAAARQVVQKEGGSFTVEQVTMGGLSKHIKRYRRFGDPVSAILLKS